MYQEIKESEIETTDVRQVTEAYLVRAGDHEKRVHVWTANLMGSFSSAQAPAKVQPGHTLLIAVDNPNDPVTLARVLAALLAKRAGPA